MDGEGLSDGYIIIIIQIRKLYFDKNIQIQHGKTIVSKISMIIKYIQLFQINAIVMAIALCIQ